MDYRPAIIQRQPRIVKQHTPESRYWRRFKHPVFVKEFGPVTSVHFSPVSPHRYAVTSGSQIQIYAPRTQKITKTISRFKEIARSGTIRHDGKLVVAGDDAGLVQVRFFLSFLCCCAVTYFLIFHIRFLTSTVVLFYEPWMNINSRVFLLYD